MHSRVHPGGILRCAQTLGSHAAEAGVMGYVHHECRGFDTA